MNKKPGSYFKNWLVDKVSVSRWAVFKDDTDEDISARIGVTLEVLHAARKKFEERTEREQLPEGQKLGYKAIVKNSPRFDIFLEPPEVIYQEWVARRDRQRLTNTVLLRSVVHRVLQSTTQPNWLGEQRWRSWVWQGQWLGQTNIRKHRFRLFTDLNEPGYRALHTRATNTRVSPSAIGRWGVSLYVAGLLEGLPIVTVPYAMYRKPEEYCLTPEITDP